MTVDVHLPDLSFVRKVEATFHINRGVYNTIDAWFYDHEIVHITERRMNILKFLQYTTANLSEEQSTKRLHFPAGLTNMLESYVERQEIGNESVFA
ncbi:hypothetical protein [Sporosarcina sp. 6E9]|uniref:hypothetical protein n=1 Tax=Sporosarcina sp. 6E9 TaxID=2819235 RepID=UPI001AC03A26|nr:hypothetical protein [Sporosarcina sp. 6E9]MBO1910393.1 hypothetical protein [Microvirga sp. 3-52]